MLKILDDNFYDDEKRFFDSIELTITPDYGESSQEITIASDVVNPKCFYSAVYHAVNSSAFSKECEKKEGVLKF